MIQFIKFHSTRYISSSEFSLVKYKDYYQILMHSKVPKWNYKFSSVECAENFLNSHDYINATLQTMPMSADDIEYIIDMYGFDSIGHNKWELYTSEGRLVLSIGPKKYQISISVDENGKLFKKRHTFDDAIDVIDFLDSFQANGIELSCIVDEKMTTQICAASKSLKDITRNLVRVKSSNVWAYGIDIRDRHDKTGNVFVQFKGKNGGPGDIYVFYDVPVTVWRGWVAAPSKGHYHWAHIRFNYKYAKLTGDRRTYLPNGVRR